MRIECDRTSILGERRPNRRVLIAMHWLASHYHSEFLATPQLIRFDHSEGQNGLEPTLLIKGSTLLLKYIAQGAALSLRFACIGNRFFYALIISNDAKEPASLWSVVEREEEKAALSSLAQGKPCQIFLFNELAVNVAWTSASVGACEELAVMLEEIANGAVDYTAIDTSASAILARPHQDHDQSSSDFLDISLPNTKAWNSISNQFVTAQGVVTPIELFDPNEGAQQERLAVWLTDSLHPLGAHHSPQVPKGQDYRELTDVLLSHEFGAVLIESKALTIFGRESLPDRAKLARDVTGHIRKAVGQLKGGIRKIKGGAPVTGASGSLIDVERIKPAHCIVMVPDLDLIKDLDSSGVEMMREFMEATGGFIHFLDVVELFRAVQAAQAISLRSDSVTPMMALDYYLMERAKKTCAAGTLSIEVLLRFSDE